MSEVITEVKENVKVKTLLSMINNTIPGVMALTISQKDINLMLLTKSPIKTSEGHDTSQWQVIHILYSGEDHELYLSGYLGALETISNYELLMQAEAQKKESKEETGIIL
jgi:hypothetical protein